MVEYLQTCSLKRITRQLPLTSRIAWNRGKLRGGKKLLLSSFIPLLFFPCGQATSYHHTIEFTRNGRRSLGLSFLISLSRLSSRQNGFLLLLLGYKGCHQSKASLPTNGLWTAATFGPFGRLPEIYDNKKASKGKKRRRRFALAIHFSRFIST